MRIEPGPRAPVKIRPSDPSLSPTEISGKNRAAITEFYWSHIGCTQGECAAALGLARKTVVRHIRKLRENWDD